MDTHTLHTTQYTRFTTFHTQQLDSRLCLSAAPRLYTVKLLTEAESQIKASRVFNRSRVSTWCQLMTLLVRSVKTDYWYWKKKGVYN